MTDGQQCPDCGVTHDDWSRSGEHSVSDGHNVGVIKRYECGECGEVMEVPIQ